MARMLDDASRAKMLASMIDNYGTEEQDQGAEFPTSSRTPVPAMAPAGSENPNREDEQEMINQKMGVQGTTRMPAGMQPIPGTNMVAVPAPLAMSAMQMLMQQGSSNAIGKSGGADGQMANLPETASDPGEEPTTDDEFERVEQMQNNRRKNLNNMRG